MILLPILNPNPFSAPLSATNPNQNTHHRLSFFISSSAASKPHNRALQFLPLRAIAPNSNPNPDPDPDPKPKPKTRRRQARTEPPKPQSVEKKTSEDETFPKTIPRKPRRGRRSEATAVEDFVRGSLERTFESIRQQSSEVPEDMEKVLKDRDDDGDGGRVKKKKEVVVEDEDPNWPLDADIGWGIRASEYFDKHSIKNVVGDDGIEIDWEGEIDDTYVKEINCLDWESIAYHPSPLIVLVFERYNRAMDNWKLLKELEKAIKVYWNAKDRLPPRSVKIDINIERDLAYALKVKECPQILFLRGNTILYREKEIRAADELVQMIAHFYYNAKKPSWIDDAARASPY